MRIFNVVILLVALVVCGALAVIVSGGARERAAGPDPRAMAIAERSAQIAARDADWIASRQLAGTDAANARVARPALG